LPALAADILYDDVGVTVKRGREDRVGDRATTDDEYNKFVGRLQPSVGTLNVGR